MKVLSALGLFICGLVKFCRNIFMISFLFVISIFILTVFMPENVLKAVEIFKNFL